MPNSVSSHDPILQFPGSRTVEQESREQIQQDMLRSALEGIRAREDAWLREKADLLQRQEMMALEFDHRLINSLQIIVSLLSLQSRTAAPEAAAQLMVAARRVASLGRVHHTLHLLDHQDGVKFKPYLQHLCQDLSDLLFQGDTGCTIAVEGAKIDIPARLAIPLGFIVNELITNSAKYAKSNIIVRLATRATIGHSLSISDDGPGLPSGFDPSLSRGLGMKIVTSLVKQIDGKLDIASGNQGHGASFTVTFCYPRLAAVRSQSEAPISQ
jgi:two-component system, sensor histidine kinase PdtaS